jgi:glycosyltransferase involved in cell wall biosynthesis
MSEPIIVMTVMVRDEVDVMAAMIEHHLNQGVDLIIATDNGSVDGTREVLAAYAETGRVEVHDYLAHDKNQSGVVSNMATRAAKAHKATWVINADADEFFLPKDPALTLRDALRRIPTGIGAFSAPVVNMTGDPARDGGFIDRLTLRDERDEASLMSTVALHAHPTADVIHVGRAGVTVQQGNHGVDIPMMGEPDDAFAIEVLHYPWRTYRQYSTKILNTGRSYDANPAVNPSPRHHGMRDYRFFNAGVLEPLYLVRHPRSAGDAGFVRDERVLQSLTGLLDRNEAVRPELLGRIVGTAWTGYGDEERDAAEEIARTVIPLEIEHIAASTAWRDMYRREAARARHATEAARRAEEELDRLQSLPQLRARRLAGRVIRGVRRRAGRLLGR